MIFPSLLFYQTKSNLVRPFAGCATDTLQQVSIKDYKKKKKIKEKKWI